MTEAEANQYEQARAKAAQRQLAEGAALADAVKAGRESFEDLREFFEKKMGYTMVRTEFQRMLDDLTTRGTLRKTKNGWRNAVKQAKPAKKG